MIRKVWCIASLHTCCTDFLLDSIYYKILSIFLLVRSCWYPVLFIFTEMCCRPGTKQDRVSAWCSDMIDTVIRHGNSLVVAGPLQSSPLVCFLVISNNHPSLSLSHLRSSPHSYLAVDSQLPRINVYINLYDLLVLVNRVNPVKQ